MISIIVPVYNAERMLPLMLESIMNQTYTDFECILINDGSTDNSYEICKCYAEQDKRFCCYTQSNTGVSATRNRGIVLAKGSHIAFLDADDVIPAEYFATLVKACRNVDIAVCDVSVLIGEKEVFRFTHSSAVLTQKQAIDLLLTRKSINSGPCAKLFRKEILKEVRYPKLKTYEDILFVLDAFQKAKQIAFTNQTQYNYIQNETGAMGMMLSCPTEDILIASDYILNFLSKHPEANPECFYVTVSHVLQYALPIAMRKESAHNFFLAQTIALYHKNRLNIIKCAAISWKEKIVLLLFAFGFAYENKKLIKIRK